eukprot:CAMPEP_0197029346 /NCGR_PEP_ID=MMETSP1384-20130603/8806_1 /TAXON_ID=29189 /ORGANISM="Ammonia sp." /LENGTH=403 /DNA_ID=CAMNT_0042458487 /DNA_START=27 /DNA_END=1238 /DNA_ORIENTATION=-
MSPLLILVSHILSITPLHASNAIDVDFANLVPLTTDVDEIEIDRPVQEHFVPSTTANIINNNIATIHVGSTSPRAHTLATPGQLIYIVTIAGITITACLLLIKFRFCGKHSDFDHDSESSSSQKTKPRLPGKHMFRIGGTKHDEEYEDDLHDIVTMHDPYDFNRNASNLSNVCSPRTPESTTMQSPYSMVMERATPGFKLSIADNVNAVYKSPSVYAVAPAVAYKMNPWYQAHAAYVMNARSKAIPVPVSVIAAGDHDEVSIARPAEIGSRSRDRSRGRGISRYSQYSEGGEPQRKITRIDESVDEEKENDGDRDAFTLPQPGFQSPIDAPMSPSPFSPNLPPYSTTNGVAEDEFVVQGGEDSDRDENAEEEVETAGGGKHQYGESVNSDDEVVVNIFSPTQE